MSRPIVVDGLGEKTVISAIGRPIPLPAVHEEVGDHRSPAEPTPGRPAGLAVLPRKPIVPERLRHDVALAAAAQTTWALALAVATAAVGGRGGTAALRR